MISKKIDIAAIVVLPVIACATVVYLNTDLLFVSSLLFFGLPALYIIFRNPGIFFKSLLFALAFSLPMSIIMDTLAALNGAYIIPKTIFPFRIFGVSTVELYIFSFLWVLFSVLFYEHFFDKGRKDDKISGHIKNYLYGSIIICCLVVGALFVQKAWLYVPYCYLLLGIAFAVLPLIIFLLNYPKFLPRFVVIGSYFFCLLLAYELAALKTHEWIFPSNQFIGFVTIANYKFPLEELFIWMIVCTPCLLAYYEFFCRRQKARPGKKFLKNLLPVFFYPPTF